MIRTSSLVRSCFLLSSLAVACGSDSQHNTSQGTGGTAATGGSAAGGQVGNGGAGAGSGGGPGSGGVVSSGGALGSGGATSSGGAVAGGGTNTGGGGGGPTDGGAVDDGGTPADGSAPPASCRTNADCTNAPGAPLCEADTGRCIACHTNAQCSAKTECTNAVCTPLTECQDSLDCTSVPGGKSICDKPNGVCVQCTSNADCGAGKACNNRVCHITCSSDNECTGQGMLCNKGLGFGGQCTQCIETSNCSSGEYCELGACVPRTCKPAQQSCDGNFVVQCNGTGSAVTPVTECTLVLFSFCMEDGDNAKCVGACENGRLDALETDVDCGGPACARCAAGKTCLLPTDCSSNDCTSSKCQ